MTIDNIADKVRAARELREHLLSDRYRPGYHFAIAEDIGRPGDPERRVLRPRALPPDVPVRSPRRLRLEAARASPGATSPAPTWCTGAIIPTPCCPTTTTAASSAAARSWTTTAPPTSPTGASTSRPRAPVSASPAAATVTTSAGKSLLVPSLDGTEFGVLRELGAGGAGRRATCATPTPATSGSRTAPTTCRPATCWF